MAVPATGTDMGSRPCRSGWRRQRTGRCAETGAHRLLVVLGEPGAGKTILLIRLVLDLLARRSLEDPVPVLIPLASWNPTPTGQDLYRWLEARLITNHPGLADPADPVPGGTATSRGRALLNAGLILPVLDGLDELPDAVRGPAIARINEALRPGQRLVLAARSQPYQEAVRPAGGSRYA